MFDKNKKPHVFPSLPRPVAGFGHGWDLNARRWDPSLNRANQIAGVSTEWFPFSSIAHDVADVLRANWADEQQWVKTRPTTHSAFTSGYGWRYSPSNRRVVVHNAEDVSGNIGDAMPALLPGRIAASAVSSKPWIAKMNGWYTILIGQLKGGAPIRIQYVHMQKEGLLRPSRRPVNWLDPVGKLYDYRDSHGKIAAHVHLIVSYGNDPRTGERVQGGRWITLPPSFLWNSVIGLPEVPGRYAFSHNHLRACQWCPWALAIGLLIDQAAEEGHQWGKTWFKNYSPSTPWWKEIGKFDLTKIDPQTLNALFHAAQHYVSHPAAIRADRTGTLQRPDWPVAVDFSDDPPYQNTQLLQTATASRGMATEYLQGLPRLRIMYAAARRAASLAKTTLEKMIPEFSQLDSEDFRGALDDATNINSPLTELPQQLATVSTTVQTLREVRSGPGVRIVEHANRDVTIRDREFVPTRPGTNDTIILNPFDTKE